MPHKCPIARAEYQRLRYQKNKERMKETRRIYRQENKEKASEYRKLWREKNSEYNREYYEKNKEEAKEYYQKNKEEIKEYSKEYYEKNKEERKEYTKSPQGIKVRRLADWRRRGLIHDDIDELYERYLQATHCEECEEEFVNDKGAKQRCMDHCHISGLFRNFLCNSCNFKRR